MSAPGSVPHGGARLAGFADRVKNLLANPFREWRATAGEATTPRDIYLGYVAPLAGLAAVSSFIGNVFVGVGEGLYTLRTGIAPALAGALVGYALAFAGVLALSRIGARLVARANEDLRLPALRVVAYSLTPVWLAAVLTSIPMLMVAAGVVALYGAFLLFVGLRTVLRCSVQEALGNAAVVAVCAWIFAILMTFRAAGAVGALFGGIVDKVRGRPSEMDLLEQLEQTAAVLAAGGRKVEPVPPEALVMLLPPSLKGMWRVGVTSGPVPGRLRATTATARYENSEGTIAVEVGDAGEAAGLARMVTWFSAYLDETSAWGYERRRRLDGHFLEEKYNRLDRRGKMILFVDDRFVVHVEGTNVDDTALLDAVQAVDARMFAALARR